MAPSQDEIYVAGGAGLYIYAFPVPVPVISSDGGSGPGADYSTPNPELTLTGTCGAVSDRILVNGATAGVAYTAGETTWSYTGTLALGANTFSVVAEGGPYNVLSGASSITIALETIPAPIVTTNGGEGYTTVTPSVALQGYCSSKATEIRVNDSTLGVTYVPGATTWTYAGELVPGPNLFTVVATNGTNASAPDSITVTLFVPAPDAPVITTNGGNGPGGNYLTNESALTLAGTCDARAAEIRVNGSASGVSHVAGQLVWSYTGTLAEGLNVFSVTGVDSSQRESAADTVSITLDSIAPRVTAAAAFGTSAVTITFSEAMKVDIALTDPLAYTFTGNGIPLSATAVARINGTTVRASVGAMTQGANYVVHVSTTSPTDLAGNHVDMLDNSAPFTGLNPSDPDTDGDGMQDSWELFHNLELNNADDAGFDPDGDGLTNSEEYELGTDPRDFESPGNAFHVDTATGSDLTGDGSSANPWKTIMYAMGQVASIATPAHRITIHLAAGVYTEKVFFSPYVGLAGADPLNRESTVVQFFSSVDPPGPSQFVVMTAAEGTAIRDLTLTFPPGTIIPNVVLLRIDDVAMVAENVIFDGGFVQNSTAVTVAGAGSSASVIVDSEVKNVKDGIFARSSGVNITENLFDAITNDAVFVQLPTTKAGSTPLLGRAGTAGSGLNRFNSVDGRSTIEGKFIRSANSNLTLAENNDWGVYTASEIEAKLLATGKAIKDRIDYDPWIGKSIGPGTVVVTLLDGEGPAQVPDSALPEVTIAPTFKAQRDSISGTFLFAAVPDGDHTVTARAEGYVTAQEDFHLRPMDIASLTLHMTSTAVFGDVNGDGDVNAVDVQLVINAVLGLPTELKCDVDNDGNTNAIDVQWVVNTVLGV